MNRALFRLSLACLAMFVLLLINVNYVQAFEGNSLADRPGNARTFNQQFQYQRGSIIAAGTGGPVTIAESRPAPGSTSGNTTYQRYYPGGPAYAPITGFDSIYGSTGIEEAYQKYLAGTASSLTVHNLISLLTGKPKQGATVYLTVSPKAQQAAYQALLSDGGHEAGVVALNPSTGAILAMASYPSFNPNRLTTLDGTKFVKIDNELLRDPAQPLLNRAINQTYPPGSSFKVITGSAGFSTGKVAGPTATVAAPQPLKLPNGNLLNNDGDETCFGGHPQVIQAFLLSCNTAFANIGMKVGGPALRTYANRFGWNDANLTIPMLVSPSVVPPITDPSYTAMTSIGQFDDQVTPLQEAMDAAAIANHGTLMRPYLLQQVQAPDLSIIGSTQPTVLSQAVSPQVASDMQQMMIQVTQNPAGTAYATAGPPAVGTSLVIAGKTGTAENTVSGAGLDDAVFTCFAPASDPKIAVGVIVKGGGFGADAAAPIAVKIIEAYLGVH
ncbi:MAG TPA: penicillin-binding protein 2 [Streptosporangiaceae bacterium]|nr:penicillin-binding protein 2 [Streptosporangiaceae bacterium]